MKKILYGILLIATIGACSRVEDNLFGKSSSDRMSKAREELTKLLIGNEAGWCLQYYPTETARGGYNLIMKFHDNDRVEIISGDIISGLTTEAYTSLYNVKADQSLVLSFDTDNDVLHEISNPPGKAAPEGDYEFLVIKSSGAGISLEGKKGHRLMQMVPLGEGVTYEDYREASELYGNFLSLPAYTLSSGDKMYTTQVSSATHALYINAEPQTLIVTYIFTQEGMALSEPLEIFGQTVTSFRYDESQNALVSTDNGTSIKIEQYFPVMNELFLIGSAWYFDPGTGHMSDAFRAKFDASDTSYTAFQYLRLGKTLAGKQQFYINSLWDGADPQTLDMECKFTPVKNTDNRMNLYYTFRWTGSNALHNLGDGTRMPILYGTIFNTEVNADEKGTEYIITPDNPDKPLYLRFTQAEDANMWFELTYVPVSTAEYFTNL